MTYSEVTNYTLLSLAYPGIGMPTEAFTKFAKNIEFIS